MSNKNKPTLAERLHDEARILNAAAGLGDGRTAYVKGLRRTAWLLSEAAFFVEGVDTERERRAAREGR